MSVEDSRELVERASRGDGEALDRLVVRWVPDVEAAVRRRAPRALRERESVSDLAQSVCRDALDRIRRGAVEYRGEPEFRAWLLRAVELKVRERWRRDHARRRDAGREEGADPDLARSQTSPSGAAARREDTDRLEEAISRLDDRSREVVRRVHLGGEEHAVVAADLGVEASHSRTILARALARLSSWVRE